jgi:hypothetical protein
MDSYSVAWRALRRRRRWALGLWLGFLPLGVLLMAVQARWPAFKSVTVLVLVVYGIAFLIAGHRWERWPCPRCGRPFRVAVRGWGGFRWPGLSEQPCANCGLEPWALGETSSPHN